jgi:hypothetical protein
VQRSEAGRLKRSCCTGNIPMWVVNIPAGRGYSRGAGDNTRGGRVGEMAVVVHVRKNETLLFTDTWAPTNVHTGSLFCCCAFGSRMHGLLMVDRYTAHYHPGTRIYLSFSLSLSRSLARSLSLPAEAQAPDDRRKAHATVTRRGTRASQLTARRCQSPSSRWGSPRRAAGRS